ncbi:MAG: dihydroorotase [Gemmatimonadales bacterium]|nr:MAG: dihydroorotase [Gemmatimonadales bacterium]
MSDPSSPVPHDAPPPPPLLLRGGRVVDPSRSVDARLDLLLKDGRVAAEGEGLEAPDGAREMDVSGLVVVPGLIDVHVHLREPGQEHKETIASGARAAAAGGFTAVCAMPNTDPVIDSPATVGFVLAAGKAAGAARVYPVGALSVGQKGERLTEIGELVEAGAVGITDDGQPVMDSGLMRRALEYAQTFDIPVADHAEDLGLSRGGAMNEGVVSARLGLAGKPNASEDVHIARDLLLAELTGGHIHLQHVSTRRGVEMIREAKARGLRVTAEATPHHMFLTDEAVEGYDTNAKMNPPLRTAEDRDAVLAGFLDGTLDTLATDHAPHHYDEKEQAFDDAPFGIVGLETVTGMLLDLLVRTGRMDLATFLERASVQPARAFHLPGGTLEEGAPADVTLLDLDREWTVDPRAFVSLSRNTPFGGWTGTGRAVATLVGGRTVWGLDDGAA